MGEGGGEREKAEVTAGNPNITPQQTLPSIQTLEKCVTIPYVVYAPLCVVFCIVQRIILIHCTWQWQWVSIQE